MAVKREETFIAYWLIAAHDCQNVTYLVNVTWYDCFSCISSNSLYVCGDIGVSTKSNC